MIHQKHLWLLIAILIVASLPACVAPDVIPRISSLNATSYFVSGHGLLIYVQAPLVVLSGCMFVLMPGLLLALALNAANSLEEWFSRGLGLSITVISIAASTAQARAGQPMSRLNFILLVFELSLVFFSFLFVRIVRGDRISWPMESKHSRLILCFLVVIPLLTVIILAPKFFWENFNGDGAHLLESSRLLLLHPLPFWPASAGQLSSYPGVTSMLSTYPVSWFLRLFGVCEGSARLPILLYLSGLFASLVSVVRHGRAREINPVELTFIAGNVFLFTIVLSFNATYNPYMADIALPAQREALYMFCFLLYLSSFAQQEKLWMIYFLFMTFMILPITQMLVGLWILSVFLVFRPLPFTELIWTAIGFACFLMLSALAPMILRSLHLPVPDSEMSLEGLQSRLGVGLPSPRRIFYVLIPSGILPAISLLAWFRQDSLNRALTLVTIGYFIFFALQEHTLLHHFVPAMILPVVIFWRTRIVVADAYRKKVRLAVGICIVLCLFLSLPTHFGPDQSSRRIGSEIEDRLAGYETLDPSAFIGAQILRDLFPPAWDRNVSKGTYVGSWNAWYYYAHHGIPGRSTNYILQPAHEKPPGGGSLISKNETVALYVLSPAVWNADKKDAPPTPVISWFYRAHRRTMFAGHGR